jgi:hypothetical protein
MLTGPRLQFPRLPDCLVVFIVSALYHTATSFYAQRHLGHDLLESSAGSLYLVVAPHIQC